MHKVSRRQRFMLTLPGLLLLVAFLIGGGIRALFIGSSSAAAADTHGTTGTGTSHQPPGSCIGEQRKPSFNSAVVVSSSEVVCGDLTSFGGDVIIHGEVNGDVVAFGGNMVITGQVDGNVSIYGGNLTSQNGSHVNGDIHVCGGHWMRGADSQLQGSVFDCTRGVSTLLANDVGVDFRFWSTVTWVVLGVFLTTLLPEHVTLVRTTVTSKARRSFALGLLSLLLAPAILAVLVALIIAIPLAILVTVVLIAAWALGTVAVGWVLGEAIVARITPQHNTRLIQIVVGLLVLALAGTLPYLGWLISVGSGLLGLGAVFLSRFGTRLYAQPKQPLLQE